MKCPLSHLFNQESHVNSIIHSVFPFNELYEEKEEIELYLTFPKQRMAFSEKRKNNAEKKRLILRDFAFILLGNLERQATNPRF